MELKHYLFVHCSDTSSLLIVPYGIETGDRRRHTATEYPFNRTLWN